MTTVKNTIEVSSNALMTGEPPSVRVSPSMRKGIRFFVGDIFISNIICF